MTAGRRLLFDNPKEAAMKRFIPVLVVVAAFVAPAGAFASTGIVLKVESGAHLVAVTRSNHVQLVHTSHHGLKVGQRVSMQARRLRNGTFSAARMRVVGRASHVRFRGLVLARSAHRITLSAGGAIVNVKSNDHPKPGSDVEVDADVNDGELEDGQTETVDQTAPGGAIEGHVVAIAAGTITIASEDQLLVIAVPTGIDITTLAIGDEVLANFAQESDGSLLLTSISADENAEAANDDNQGDDNQGDDNGGDGGDGGGGDGGSGGGD
jgi:hypothetical protein